MHCRTCPKSLTAVLMMLAMSQLSCLLFKALKYNPDDVVDLSNDLSLRNTLKDFLGGTVDKNLPANARDMGLILGPGRLHMPWATKAVHRNY